METRITFEIAGEQYTMFVEGILKKKYYLSKDNKGSVLADPVPVKVTASTMKEAIMYWLECLQAHMRKKRFQKKSQSGRGCAGNRGKRVRKDVDHKKNVGTSECAGKPVGETEVPVSG